MGEWTTIRVTTGLRERIKARADREGVSVAQWSERALAAALGDRMKAPKSVEPTGAPAELHGKPSPALRRASGSLAIDKGKPRPKTESKRGR